MAANVNATLLILVGVLSLCSCSQLSQNKHKSSENRYKAAFSYTLQSEQVAVFYRDMFLDSASNARLASISELLPPDVFPFEPQIVKMKFGLVDNPNDNLEYRKRIHEEVRLSAIRGRACIEREEVSLKKLGVNERANISVAFSCILSDVVPGRELLVGEIQAIYNVEQEELLREQGVATDMRMRLLFIFKADVVDTVLASWIAK